MYYWNLNFKYLSLFACAFFYRLFIVIGRHLLFIKHHMRSGLGLGLQLLEGRNTLAVPEDVPPCMSRGITISAWVKFYTLILCRGHLGVTGTEIPCLCLPGMDRMEVLRACLRCTHMPGSRRYVPMWWSSPA